MANFSDFIDKHHDFGLKDFSGVCEVSDITESINPKDFLTRNDNVDKFWVSDDFGDYLCTSFTETYSEQSTNFDD